MALRNIDLTNKCGSCCWFRRIGDTASGECLRNPYGDSVVHDPKHPYWVVTRSRIKCTEYNAKPMTNADHIRAMSDEELAAFLDGVQEEECKTLHEVQQDGTFKFESLRDGWLAWLQQPAEEGEHE